MSATEKAKQILGVTGFLGLKVIAFVVSFAMAIILTIFFTLDTQPLFGLYVAVLVFEYLRACVAAFLALLPKDTDEETRLNLAKGVAPIGLTWLILDIIAVAMTLNQSVVTLFTQTLVIYSIVMYGLVGLVLLLFCCFCCCAGGAACAGGMSA